MCTIIVLYSVLSSTRRTCVCGRCTFRNPAPNGNAGHALGATRGAGWSDKRSDVRDSVSAARDMIACSVVGTTLR